MRICMITGTMPPAKCGVGDYTEILSNGLAKIDDLELSVITTQGLGDKEPDYKVYPIVKKWDFSCINIILNKIDEIKPDIVHIQYPTTEYKKYIFINFLPFILKCKNYTVITTIHEFSDNSSLGKFRLCPNILFSKKIIVVDPRFKEDILKKSIFKHKDVQYVNIGSNIPKSNINDSERVEIRQKILASQDTFIIGYFGFINSKKGVETIINSISKLIDNGIENVKFLIIGELSKDDNYHLMLLNMIEELKLKENVYITGYLPKEEVGKYINITNVMALPFANGVSPRNGSFLAAKQESKPVITTRPKTGENDKLFSNVYYLENYNDIEGFIRIINNLIKDSNRAVPNNNQNNSEIDWNSISYKHYEIYTNALKE